MERRAWRGDMASGRLVLAESTRQNARDARSIEPAELLCRGRAVRPCGARRAIPHPARWISTGPLQKRRSPRTRMLDLAAFGIGRFLPRSAHGCASRLRTRYAAAALAHVREVSSSIRRVPGARRRDAAPSRDHGDAFRRSGPTCFRCSTLRQRAGSRRIRQWLTQPVADPMRASARHDAIDALLSNPCPSISARAEADSRHRTHRIAHRAAQCPSARPCRLRDTLAALPRSQRPSRRRCRLFDDSRAALAMTCMGRAARQSDRSRAAANLRDGGVIADGYDAELTSCARSTCCGSSWWRWNAASANAAGRDAQGQFNRVHVSTSRCRTRTASVFLRIRAGKREECRRYITRNEGVRDKALRADVRWRERSACSRPAGRTGARVPRCKRAAMPSPTRVLARSPSARQRCADAPAIRAEPAHRARGRHPVVEHRWSTSYLTI